MTEEIRKHQTLVLAGAIILAALLLSGVFIIPNVNLAEGWVDFWNGLWSILNPSDENGDGDGTGNGDDGTNGVNGNGVPPPDWYIVLSIDPTESTREDVELFNLVVTTNTESYQHDTGRMLNVIIEFTFVDENTWIVWEDYITLIGGSASVTGPENDFFSGMYEWRARALSSISPATSGVVICESSSAQAETNGLSVWITGDFNNPFPSIPVDTDFSAEVGSSYTEWCHFFWTWNEEMAWWQLVYYEWTDLAGRIGPDLIMGHTPTAVGTYEGLVTVSFTQPFEGLPSPEFFSEQEPDYWQYLLEDYIAQEFDWLDFPDPNGWWGDFRESNYLIATVTA